MKQFFFDIIFSPKYLVAEISHRGKIESKIFLQKKFHIVHALVFVEIRVFQKPVLSRVCPHTRLRGIKELTWKTFGILNTKLGAMTVRGQRIQVII